MSYNSNWDGVFNPGRADDYFRLAQGRPMSGDGRRFDYTDAWLFSELSRLIYCRGRKGQGQRDETAARNRYLHPVGLEERWYYNGRFLQCAFVQPLAGREPAFTVVVFRGAQRGGANLWPLFQFMLSPWPSGGAVHGGFKHILLQSWKDIEPFIRKVDRPLCYTGHSLGGALAVLAASIIPAEAVYTFGSPKIGDESFCESVENLNIYRVANSRDIVTRLPPFSPLRHVGKPHILESAIPQWSRQRVLDAPVFLSDHSPINYSLRMLEMPEEEVLAPAAEAIVNRLHAPCI